MLVILSVSKGCSKVIAFCCVDYSGSPDTNTMNLFIASHFMEAVRGGGGGGGGAVEDSTVEKSWVD